MEITPEAPVIIFGLPMEGFNLVPLLNTWLIIGLLVLIAWLVSRSLKTVPGRVQVLFEAITEFFADICNDTLGEEYGRKYMPFIATLFVFVLCCNVLGAVPNVLWWTGWPGFRSPTQDLNTPLGLALIVIVVVHVSAVRVKGFRAWLWSFYEPDFPADTKVTKVVGLLSLAGAAALNYVLISRYAGAFGAMGTGARAATGLMLGAFVLNSVLVVAYSLQLKRVPNVLMAPLNFVGEIGKGISHPFRLFGNIFGGFVIVSVISQLIFYIGLPPLLSGFFDLFVGLVHAFVFAMLALAYIAVQIRD